MSGPNSRSARPSISRRPPRPSRAKGPYEVVRVLPAEGANPRTYRIKSKVEPFERAANEYDLVAVAGGPPNEPQGASWLPAARKPRS